MSILSKEFVGAFKAEARRQESFTNSFWRQLAVILVSIAIINVVGPWIIFYGTNITAQISMIG